MERLTNHFDYCKMIECKYHDEELHKQNKCKFFDVDISHCHEKSMNDKLREYEDAEEQGLLIRLPCKVWDTLYEASRQWKTVITRTVAAIVIYNNNIWIRNGCGDTFEYGVEVFLTKEEAEKALERMGEDGNKSRTS